VAPVGAAGAGAACTAVAGVITVATGVPVRSRARRQRDGIQDQGNFAIGQHGGARQAGNARELGPDGLDHDFLVSGKAIHFQRDALRSAANQQNPVAAFLRREGGGVAKQDTEVVVGIGIAQPLGAAGFANLGGGGGAVFSRLLDHRGWHRIVAAADGDHHHLGHGQRQWQIDAEGGALAADRGDLDAAAEAGGLVAHHVHADAAPGQRGDFVRGGEAGLHDHLRQRVLVRRQRRVRAGRGRWRDGESFRGSGRRRRR
jgi:hypothetical protein